jgi:hypothetical protein
MLKNQRIIGSSINDQAFDMPAFIANIGSFLVAIAFMNSGQILH